MYFVSTFGHYRSRGLEQLVRSRNIRTVGDLCNLSEYEVHNLPIRSPKVPTLRKVLKQFEDRTDRKTAVSTGNSGGSGGISGGSKGDSGDRNLGTVESTAVEEKGILPILSQLYHEITQIIPLHIVVLSN